MRIVVCNLELGKDVFMKNVLILSLSWIILLLFCFQSDGQTMDFDVLQVYPDTGEVRLLVHETGESRIFLQGETINNAWTIVKVSEHFLTVAKLQENAPILQINIPLENFMEERIQAH